VREQNAKIPGIGARFSLTKMIGNHLSAFECGDAIFSPMRNRLNAKPLPWERRGVQRRVINRVAQYRCGLGALPRVCMVTDISASGARLYSEADMPETFTLSVTVEDADIKHECRVVWRLGGEVGVTFIDGCAR
jgi:PilZ domain